MSSVSQEKLQGVVSALRILSEPNPSNDSVAGATRLLASAKASEQALSLAQILVQPGKVPKDVTTRAVLFGLQILATQVRAKRKGPPMIGMQKLLLGFVRNLPRDLSGCPGAIRNRAAMVLSQLAVREYPQQWPDLMKVLKQMLASGAPTYEYVASVVLQMMAEQAASADFNGSVPARRRNEILKGLDGAMAELGPLLLRGAQACYAACKDSPAVHSPQAELCAQITATLASFVPWVASSQLRPLNLHRVLPSLCRIDGAQTSCAAAECLVQLAGRSYKGAEEADLLLGALHACAQAARQGAAVTPGRPLFGAEQRGATAIPAVTSFLGDPCATPARPEFFTRHSMHALCHLCTRQSSNIIALATQAGSLSGPAVTLLRSLAGAAAGSTTSPRIVGVEAIGQVLQTLIAVLSHPCQTFAALAPQGIEAILRQCRTVTWTPEVLARQECPGLAPRLPTSVARLIPGLCRSLARLLTKDLSFAYVQANPMGGGDTQQQPPAASCTYMHGQVDGLGEYQQQLSTIRSHAGRLLQVCGSCSPASAVQALSALSTHLAVPVCETKPNDGLERCAGGGLFTSKASSSYVALEAATLATSQLANGLPEEAVRADSPLLPALGAVAAAWVDRCKSPDPRLDGQGMKGSVSLWRIIMHNRTMLQTLIARLFATGGAKVHPAEQEAGGIDSAPSDRRHSACNGLSRLGRKLPAVLVAMLPDLAKRSKALIESGVLPSTCDTLVLEMLVSVSNVDPDGSRRIKFLSDVLQLHLGFLTSEPISAAFKSPQAMLSFVGLLGAPGSTPPPMPPGAPAGAGRSSASRRDFFLRLFFTMWTVGRRSLPKDGHPPPFSTQWRVALPATLMTISAIHGMFAPKAQEVLLSHPQARFVLAMPGEEVRMLLGNDSDDVETPEPGTREAAAWDVSVWVSRVLWNSQALFGLAAAHGRFGLFSKGGAVALQAHWEHVLGAGAARVPPLRVVRLTIRNVVLPIVRHCPPDQRKTLLGRLGPFLQGVVERLAEAANLRSGAAAVAGGTSGGSSPGIVGAMGAGGFTAAAIGSMPSTGPGSPMDPAHVRVPPPVAPETADALRDKVLLETGKAIVDVFYMVSGAQHRLEAMTAAALGNGPKRKADTSGERATAGSASGGGTSGRDELPDKVQLWRLKPLQGPGEGKSMGPNTLGNLGEDPGGLRRSVMFEVAATRGPMLEAGLAALEGTWTTALSAKRACEAWTLLLPDAVHVPPCYPLVAGRLFSQLVRALVIGKPWVQPLEADLISLVADLYVRFVLPGTMADKAVREAAVVSSSAVDAAAAGGGGELAAAAGGPRAPISDLPRRFLCSLDGVPQEQVRRLEAELAPIGKAKTVRKKLRDFLQNVAAYAVPAEAAGASGGILRPAEKAVADLQAPVPRWQEQAQREKEKQALKQQERDAGMDTYRMILGSQQDDEDEEL